MEKRNWIDLKKRRSAAGNSFDRDDRSRLSEISRLLSANINRKNSN